MTLSLVVHFCARYSAACARYSAYEITWHIWGLHGVWQCQADSAGHRCNIDRHTREGSLPLIMRGNTVNRTNYCK